MAQVKLEEEAELWDPAEHNSSAVDFSHVKEESELCIKKEPDEFPFHIVKVEDDDEDKVLHQRTTEENRSKTNGEEEAEAGCSSEALTHLQSGSEEDIDCSSDTDHSVDYSQEQPPSKRSYAMINNDTRPFKCSECGKGFPRNSELRRHVLIHSGQKPYQCSVCGRECRLKYQLQIHMGIHTGGKPEICSVCKKGYVDYDSLTDHMKTHIEDVTPDETLVNDDAMTNTDSLVQDVGHVTKPHKCIVCGKRFVCNSELQRHVLIHTGEKPFRCSVCEQEFRHKHHLDSHMRSHTGERPFSCSVCNKGFSRNYCLTAHMRLHTGERPFVCPVCEKGFTQHSILRDHMKTHPKDWSADQTLLNCSSTMTTDSSVSDLGRDPKPFKCSVCGRAFQRNAYLKNHMLIHTGEKPFRCPVCKKDFRDKGNLKIHMRTHTGEKPFSCPFCQKSFKLKRDLVIHMRVHTGEKPFTCPICKKGFVTNTYLRTHLRTHTGEKPFSCTVCKKCFTQKSSLRTHVRGHRTDTSNEGQNVIQSTVA